MLQIRNLVRNLRTQSSRFLDDVKGNQSKSVLFTILLVIAIVQFPFGFSNVLVTLFNDFGFVLCTIILFCVLFSSQKTLSDYFQTSRDSRTKESEILYYTSLTVLFVLSVILFTRNLTNLSPYTDEIPQLLTARKIYLGEPFVYTRATAVSYIISLFFHIGSPSNYLDYLFWGRLPGAIFGALTVFPIYFLFKKISRPIALISCVLWAICPWAIAVSRYAREYAYYPFLVLVALTILISLLDLILDDWRKKKLRILFSSLFLLFFVFYATLFDTSSTIKISFVVIGLILAWYSVIFFKRILKSRKNLLATSISISVLFALLLFAFLKFSDHSSLGLSIDRTFISVFLSPSISMPHLWWHGYEAFGSIAYLLIGSGVIFFYQSKDRRFFLWTLMFFGLLLFYYLLFDRYFKPRYCFYVLPFLIVMLASGIYHLSLLAIHSKNRIFQFLSIAILLAFMFPIFDYKNTVSAIGDKLVKPVSVASNSRYAGKIKNTGYNPISGEYHQELIYAAKYLKKRISDEDVFITTVFRAVLILELGIPEDRIISYNYKKSHKEHLVAKMIEKHNQGWLILDFRRHGKFTPTYFSLDETNYFYNSKLKLVRDKNEAQIFRWNKNKE